MTPRMAIGTVDAAEFFVTATILVAFIGTLGLASFTIAVSGLLIGGVLAAPFGAYLTRRIAPKLLLTLVISPCVIRTVKWLATVLSVLHLTKPVFHSRWLTALLTSLLVIRFLSLLLVLKSSSWWKALQRMVRKIRKLLLLVMLLAAL